MKKRVIIIALLIVILFSVAAAASAESKEEYYGKIYNSLRDLGYALNDNDKPRANVVLGELRVHVYSCMRYMVKIGEYDSRLIKIVDNANKAYTACFNGLDYEIYFPEAYELAWIILMKDSPEAYQEESSHS